MNPLLLIKFGPYAIIGPGVQLGDGCRIWPHAVLEHVSLGQILRGELPPAITRFTNDPDAWITRNI